MNRRKFNINSLLFGTGILFSFTKSVWAKTYISIEQAQTIIWPNITMQDFEVVLTKTQIKSIKSSSKTRVTNSKIKGFKSENGEWLIIDQVIGKHEFIDLAVGINAHGEVIGIEILKYQESYGYEIMNPKWLAQFYKKNHSEILKLDKQIKNISGATMSCRHVTDGVNRLTHTWQQVLQNL